MPKISVIIPVYNTAKYLEKCLESVCNQTLQDIEILCINDASPDNSLEILKAYASRDARLKIIDFKKNKGVSIARNTAMEQATGEYIGFVDSDDWIDLDFYEKLYTKAKDVDSDLAIGEGRYSTKNKTFKIFEAKTIKQYKFLYIMFVIGIYKKEMIEKNNIIFTPNCIFGEDRMFPIMASYYAKNFTTVENTYYNYYNRDNSATKIITTKKINDFIKISKLIVRFINSNNLSVEKYNIIIKDLLQSLLHLFYYADSQSFNDLRIFILWVYNNLKYSETFNSIDLGFIESIKKNDKKLIFKYISLLHKRKILDYLINDELKKIKNLRIKGKNK